MKYTRDAFERSSRIDDSLGGVICEASTSERGRGRARETGPGQIHDSRTQETSHRCERYQRYYGKISNWSVLPKQLEYLRHK